jgi:hypothetical protein
MILGKMEHFKTTKRGGNETPPTRASSDKKWCGIEKKHRLLILGLKQKAPRRLFLGVIFTLWDKIVFFDLFCNDLNYFRDGSYSQKS